MGKKILRRKRGIGANGGFGYTKEKRELIVEKYEEKRGGLGSTVDLILYRNKTNCEEKRRGLEPLLDLKQNKKKKKKKKKTFSGLSESLMRFTITCRYMKED